MRIRAPDWLKFYPQSRRVPALSLRCSMGLKRDRSYFVGMAAAPDAATAGTGAGAGAAGTGAVPGICAAP